ncbi:Duf620 family protein [Thalictrum thalictroides]|uniref:Duf620 family protein n=1 Tax=Thalictrum thalictroides TaxID=46969 RepID=A0A7J6V928_THATH|nr:Duf620 family protein [Thalictrum thalictroides]
MRKLCPNYDREDGLETVLEVPIPEEMFVSSTKNNVTSWKNMKSWMKAHIDRSVPPSTANQFGDRSSGLQILLGVVGAPLVPLPVTSHQSINSNIKDHPIEHSAAKYIVQQYIGAVGGDKALNGVDSMYAMGKVRMIASEFSAGDGYSKNNSYNNKKEIKANYGGGGGEVGAFVLWQKRPDLWCLELVLSGCKISAGSDGKVAWRQTPWHHSHASRGPPRPLRRSLQGLDPRSTANLFSKSICMGEKVINDEDCFVLKLEAEPSTLRARSSSNVEMIRHTIWGYFSQKTALLLKLEDSHLLKIKTAGDDSIFWETTMESLIQDYRTVDGINIAHGGRTFVSLFRFGESTENQSRTRMEEVWTIEEVDFNIKGLSMDCFLPPGDLKKEQEVCNPVASYTRLPVRTRVTSAKLCSSKVVAIDVEDFHLSKKEDV